MDKIKTAILGGAGYTAGELIRLLVNHPKAEIVFVQSTSNQGNKITDVHSGLTGETNLTFTGTVENLDNIDALFLCSAHGDSRKFFADHKVPERIKIIDLSMDYRHRETAEGFIYGLPELNRGKIYKARRIANPGCFATAIQLALLPLAAAGKLTNEIHIQAITGSTGAGVKQLSTTQFSWRNNNISIYKPFTHQHLKEITESLSQLQPSITQQINLIPVRGDFPRGIFTIIYTDTELSSDTANNIYRDFYKDSAFTFITDANPDLKQVVNTNKCLIHIEKHGNKLLILSLIDNLLKGASGQAVQNFNLMFGLEEKTGLMLKSSGF
ncbi:MAG: N-acetyl-gamma-glutamyl-phosphate reductase [Dysgonamonadaceae bacterium]|jgi:N-acetyl-gamma-glutamyl-phosphate reductase|nr:N-acetyl-gamma-glutamyl-phosphate reductase [Dysgonamonadaceae bacterium]